MNLSPKDTKSENLEAQKLIFKETFKLSSVNGADVIKFFDISNLECRWLRPVEEGMTWALLLKAKTRFLVDSVGLDREILVLCTRHGEIQPRLFNQVQAIRNIVNTEFRFHPEILIVIGSEDASTTAIESYSNRDRSCIWISDTDIVAENQSPNGILLKKICTEFYAKDFFDVTGPVTGSQFFGRSKILQEIERDFISGSNVGLFGLRKVGKTSIIKALCESGKKKYISAIHIDLLSFLPIHQKLHFILYNIYTGMKENSKFDFSATQHDIIKNPNEFVSNFTINLPDVLKRLDSEGHRVVVILDEIEKLFPTSDGKPGFDNYEEILSYLRGISQTHQNFSLMVVGVNPHIAEAQLLGKSQNPMFGFFSIKYAPPMSLDETKEMMKKLGKSSGIDFDFQAIDYAYEALGGHPFLTRKYCSCVISEKIRPICITKTDMEAAKSSFFRKEISQFSEMVGVVRDYYPSEFAELHRISLAGKIAEDGVSPTILAHLEGYQLISIDKKIVTIKNIFIKEWLSNLAASEVSSISQTTHTKKSLRILGDVSDDLRILENEIRGLIREQLVSRWKGKSEDRIKMSIGDVAWSSAIARQARTINSREVAEGELIILEYLNYGDLKSILVGNEWGLFRHIFPDKKKLEQSMEICIKTRNDTAHSRDIDAIEEMRTKVAIADMFKCIDGIS